MQCTALILLGSSWLRIIWTRKRIDTVPHQNIVFHGVLKHIPWATFDRLVTEHNADWDERVVKTRAHLIAMLLAQFCGARSLREIETNLKSHAGKLYHLGGEAVSRSALSSANASRRRGEVHPLRGWGRKGPSPPSAGGWSLTQVTATRASP